MAAAVAVALACTACQTPGGIGGGTAGAGSQSAPATPLSPEEQRLRDDNRRFNEVVLGGCGIGAAGGAVAGVVVAAVTRQNMLRAALAGGAVGCVIGGADGYVTARRELAANNELRATQAMLKDVQDDNAFLRNFVERSTLVIQQGEQRLRELRGSVDARRVSLAEAEQSRQRESANIAEIGNRLARQREIRDNYRTALRTIGSSPAQKRNLDEELMRMDQQVRQLEGSLTSYQEALRVSKA